MEKDKLADIMSSIWDGKTKSFTIFCPECEFYRTTSIEDRCYWGVAYKVLDKTKILSYCQLTNKPSPRIFKK